MVMSASIAIIKALVFWSLRMRTDVAMPIVLARHRPKWEDTKTAIKTSSVASFGGLSQ